MVLERGDRFHLAEAAVADELTDARHVGDRAIRGAGWKNAAGAADGLGDAPAHLNRHRNRLVAVDVLADLSGVDGRAGEKFAVVVVGGATLAAADRLFPRVDLGDFGAACFAAETVDSAHGDELHGVAVGQKFEVAVGPDTLADETDRGACARGDGARRSARRRWDDRRARQAAGVNCALLEKRVAGERGRGGGRGRFHGRGAGRGMAPFKAQPGGSFAWLRSSASCRTSVSPRRRDDRRRR